MRAAVSWSAVDFNSYSLKLALLTLLSLTSARGHCLLSSLRGDLLCKQKAPNADPSSLFIAIIVKNTHSPVTGHFSSLSSSSPSSSCFILTPLLFLFCRRDIRLITDRHDLELEHLSCVRLSDLLKARHSFRLILSSSFFG